MWCHRPRILLIYVKRSYLDIDQGGLNVSVPHKMHEGGQTNAGAYHV